MIQNSSPATTDILESDASSRYLGNNYANIDPSTLNSAPVPPAGIPTNYVNVTPACVTSFQETVQGHQTEQRHSLESSHACETSKNSSKIVTSNNGQDQDRITNEIQSKNNQGHVANEIESKSNEEYVETNLMNSSEDVDIPPDIGKLPEYMNVDVPQDQKADITNMPAPPVPPRGKKIFFFFSFFRPYEYFIMLSYWKKLGESIALNSGICSKYEKLNYKNSI